MTDRVLTKVSFRDPARAARNLQSLTETFITSGCRFTQDEFETALNTRLMQSPDPDMALNNLQRFVEASVSRATLFNDLVQYPVLAEVLLKVFSYSQYFADILVRDPELFRWLTASDSLMHGRTRAFFDNEVRRALSLFKTPDRALDALRRLYRREIVRVGARDILENAGLSSVTAELSRLADALIQASCDLATTQLAEKYPKLPSTPYAVIGLGKLGGEELNYSSDIDIMFLYGDEGEIKNSVGKAVTYHEYFNRFVELLVRNLSHSSAEGHLYRVDTRLRPEGKSGPLARSLGNYMLYYELRGELWERQMLIKARPVAGDGKLGERFIGQLQPFIYPRTFFQHPAEAVARIKARIEAAIDGEENVKLRRGGIRDIEFIAQTLQLLNGGKNSAVRENNTLRAIAHMEREGLLSKPELETLGAAYGFLRTLEHRLQMMLNLQTHTLPMEEHVLQSLALKMGISNAGTLRMTYEEHLKNVRAIYENVLSVRSSDTDRTVAAVLEGGLSGELVQGVLRQLGFRDVKAASKNIQVLLRGSALGIERGPDNRTQEAFKSVAGEVFAEIGKTPIPDLTLKNLAVLASGQRLPDVFYKQMKDLGFRKLVLQVCAVSSRFVKTLADRPHLMDRIVSGVSSRSAGLKGRSFSVATARIEAETVAGVKNVLGLSTFGEFTAELSATADELLAEVLRRRIKTNMPPFAVFALGKFGTGEITVDSDLDLLFICETRSAAGKAGLEKLATEFVRDVSKVGMDGRGYEVDARLRPEGRSAPLVVARAAYEDYLLGRASLWERQSLTRLRFVCGDKKLAGKVMAGVQAFVYDSPLPADWVKSMVAMREAMERRSRFSSNDHIDFKVGAGGMVDIEFIAQMYLLSLGTRGRPLHGAPTPTVIGHIPDPLLDSDIRSALLTGYAALREMEKLVRISLEEHSSLLPRDEKLDVLARLLGYQSGGSLRDSLREQMRETRAAFLWFCGNLTGSAEAITK